ncbi:MAG TPA: serine/threonine-protein kinase [Terriglobia bacterium]|nr:serine/threonine-protein kinase [Terriglobia bacterium]
MTADRWLEINRRWDAASAVPDKERAPFRKDVHKMWNCFAMSYRQLAFDKLPTQFLERPALELIEEELASEAPVVVGRQYGPYQIVSVLGVGGMGEVYKAIDTRLNRTVAIKVLSRHLAGRGDLRHRLEREARAIASLDHPRICALYDVGHEHGMDFLVMQYLEGETLAQRLKRGLLSNLEVFRYAIEITEAVAEAHKRGLIHRDLKPDNIMLTQTGAKLLDFGLAKRHARSSILGGTLGQTAHSAIISQAGMLIGTLQYMAPEQLEGEEADARTDVFALGLIIYEMATGQKAFQAKSKARLIAAILTSTPPKIASFRRLMPTELEAVVRKCLEKSPTQRWQTAIDLALQLTKIAGTSFLSESPSIMRCNTNPHADGSAGMAAVLSKVWKGRGRGCTALPEFRLWSLAWGTFVMLGILVAWFVTNRYVLQ